MVRTPRGRVRASRAKCAGSINAQKVEMLDGTLHFC
jgi:hypothetical protein